MIEAELHNKVGDLSGSEDALTSSVFGILKYVFMKEIFTKFIGSAVRYFNNEEAMQSEIVRNHIFDSKLNFMFWERICNSEPDIIIESHNSIIIIEVKYGSIISGEDQLEKYYKSIEKENRFKNKNIYLIYLTADPCQPDLSKKATEYLKNKNFYWLSWNELYEIIKHNQKGSNPENEVSRDLFRILRNREVMLFEGFAEYNSFNNADKIFWEGNQVFFLNYMPVLLDRPLFWKGVTI